MRRIGMLLTLGCFFAGSAFADMPIAGWNVSSKPDSSGTCLGARAYNDKDDNNKRNSVVFGLVKGKAGLQMALVLGYEDWHYDKNEKIVGDLIVDGKVIYTKWDWEGDGSVLTGYFADTDTLIPIFGNGKKIVVRFGKDGEANFLTPNAGLALGAVEACVGS